MDTGDFLAWRENAFEVQALTEDRRSAQRKYPNCVIDPRGWRTLCSCIPREPRAGGGSGHEGASPERIPADGPAELEMAGRSPDSPDSGLSPRPGRIGGGKLSVYDGAPAPGQFFELDEKARWFRMEKVLPVGGFGWCWPGMQRRQPIPWRGAVLFLVASLPEIFLGTGGPAVSSLLGGESSWPGACWRPACAFPCSTGLAW